MESEIPAGTKVKVAMTAKGVTTIRDAEVLAHMDGLIHLDMDGDAVSVAPSQIVSGDAPAVPGDPGADQHPADLVNDPPAPAENPGVPQIVADLIAQLTARMDALEADARSIMAAIGDLQTRTKTNEEWILAHGAALNPPALAADPAPAPAEENPNAQESTAAADPGGSAAGS